MTHPAIRRFATVGSLALLSLLMASCPGSSSPWRSALYPESWQPGYADAQGRFLHDFSYAGYRNGEAAIPDAPPLPSFDASGYGADPTGQTDSTAALQAAINAAVAAGGGVVLIPQGIFRCDGTLLVQGSNVVLRGAGRESTRLYFTQSTAMANRSHLTFQGNVTHGTDIPLAQDGQNGSTQVIVNDAASLSPGDEVAVGWTISEAFVAEHGMTGTWQAFNGQWRPFFRRTVIAVESNVITLDVPLRYPARLRDGASLRKEAGYLRECGVEHLSLSNAVDWDIAWSMYRVHLLEMAGTKDSWIRDVASFASPSPEADGYHLQNCGFGLVDCKRITVADCRLEKAQNRGTGGCGYLFEISRSNEILLRDCAGIDGRHNFIQNWDFGTTGCVFLRCRSAGGRNLLGKNDPIGVPAYSEYHHSLAMACLVDSCILDDGWYGGNRQDESSGAGHSVTQSVYWNTSGKGILKSWQYGWGCVIGTRGVTVATGLSDFHALLGSAEGTAPEDFKEGVGNGATLEPQSLYENQLARRLANNSPANTYYVSPLGQDTFPGTSAKPFKTIQKAADIVSPGDVVIVADGTYSSTTPNYGSEIAIVRMLRSGTPTRWITFRAEHEGKAIIDGSNYNATHGFMIDEGASYIKVEGFEIKNISTWAIPVFPNSSHLEFRDNHIHHIGNICTATTNGLCAFNLMSVDSVLIERNLIHDIGRLSPSEGCAGAEHYRWNDHGIYADGVNNSIIRNNVFYNIFHGWGLHFYSSSNRSSNNVSVLNNTFAFNKMAAGLIILYDTLTDITIQNNLLYMSANADLEGVDSSSNYGIVINPSYPYTRVTIDHNMMFRGNGIIAPVTNGVTISNNIVNTDPQLLGPATFDFRLGSGSPAINAGVDVGLATDFLGNPIAGIPDIGAYEFHPTPLPTRAALR